MRWPFGGKGRSGSPTAGDRAGTPAEAELVGARGVIPCHLAVIMDGNGRWAKERHLPRIEGHRAGAKTVRMVVEESRRLGIKYLTLFSFSTENWLRPAEEVSGLMRLFCQYVESERELLLRNGIRLRAIGDRSKLPHEVQNSLGRIEKDTESLQDMQLILALSYGGRDEILRAVRSIASEVTRGNLTVDAVDSSVMQAHLYAPDVPDPDMLLRTSDEYRISNFLLWQMAYTELVITKTYWPGLGSDEFKRCIAEFGARRRRFGRTDEQFESEAKPSSVKPSEQDLAVPS